VQFYTKNFLIFMVAIVRHPGVIDFSKSYMPIYSLLHLIELSVIAFMLKTCFYREKQEISCKECHASFTANG